MGLLDALGEFSHRLFRVGRNVRAHRLRIDQEQVERRVEVVKKIDDASTPRVFLCLPCPTALSGPPVFDNVTSLGILGYEINEGFPLIISPNVVGLSHERARLGDGYGLVHTAIMYAIGAVRQGKMLREAPSPALPEKRPDLPLVEPISPASQPRQIQAAQDPRFSRCSLAARPVASGARQIAAYFAMEQTAPYIMHGSCFVRREPALGKF